MSEADLSKKLAEKRAALRGFRFDVAGSKIKNVKEGHNLRKEIAQIMTALNAKRAEARRAAVDAEAKSE